MTNLTPSEAALDWANRVVAGDAVGCLYVRLACQRFIDDLERSQADDWPYYFNARQADKVCKFEQTMPHVKGVWARRGELLVYEPWQLFIEANIFGWLRKNNDLRRFTESYEEVARKNAKSTRLAARGNYLFAADGEFGAEVYSGATTEKQAWEIFGPARQMARNKANLRERFGIEVNAKSMVILDDNSKFTPIIGKPGDGASPSAALVDEYHEHQTDDLVETMVTGMGAREQPLLSIITTAGVDFSGPCHDKRAEVIKILQREVIDETIFGIIFTADDNDEWDSDEAIVKANPNLDVSISFEYLKSQRDKARRSASKQNSFKTKHLNLWVGAQTAWMNMLSWQRQADRSVKLADMANHRAWLAIDLASKLDVAALCALVEDGDIMRAFFRFYAPEDAAIDNQRYRNFHTAGDLILTPGSATDYGFIENDVCDLAKLLDVQDVAFDSWQAQYLAQRLGERGLPMIEFPHQVRTMSDPMKEVEARITDRTLFHDGNSMMTWMIGNVVAKTDAKDNIYPRKEKPELKIDGPVTLIMAEGRYLIAANEPSFNDFLKNPVAV